MADSGATQKPPEAKKLTPYELYLEALKFRDAEIERTGGDTVEGVKAVQDAFAGLLINQKERV